MDKTLMLKLSSVENQQLMTMSIFFNIHAVNTLLALDFK